MSDAVLNEGIGFLDFSHTSVLLNECIEGLNINPNGTYVDCTLGGAGHSLQILKKLSPSGTLIGIDQDINAINKSTETLKYYKDNIILINDNFFNIKNILLKLDIKKVDGFLLDLGVSSHQLDTPTRGFSYNYDNNLDMRMDTTKNFTAFDVVNNYSKDKLKKIIYEYGEDKWADRIAEFIIDRRKISPINTTFELVQVIKDAVPKNARREGPHPAKRTFQAIRIEVNNELGILESSIKNMIDFLNPEGRICVITFHSLEDRIIKNVFKQLENPCTCPRDFPICICGKKQEIKIITKKPIVASEQELIENHRSRSAKLRISEKF